MMSTVLAPITQEPDPQLPLLCNALEIDPQTETQREVQANLHTAIDQVINSIQNPGVRDVTQTILNEMFRFFDWLDRIENNLHKLDTLQESLSLLEVIEFEARSLLDFIDHRALKVAAGNERLHEVLDGITYGISHDLRRIFEREIVRGVTEHSIPIVYGKILHAHGLLTNCFQQSTITLLQVFNPSLGTDGWRAVIAREFTYVNVERVAQAYADFLKKEAEAGLGQQPFVVIGFDRRFLSENFAARAAEVMAGNGCKIALFTEAQPTPLISWAVKDLGAAGGVMITASHNPANFNGFKIKAPWGGSAAPETTRQVENLVDATPPKRATVTDDGHELLEPATERYRQHIAAYVDLERLKSATGKVIVDPMHGSAGRWVESFLNGGSLSVETIREIRDPLFGGVNPEPIDQNLEPLKQRVVETGALVGLATDGDADRVGAVDERGRTMTMHDVVPLLLLHLARARKIEGAVVVTVSQSVLTKRIAHALGLKVYETPIGFKYIADLMLKEDILLGAEESGGIGVKGHIPERDGVLNSLLFLEAIVSAEKSPSEMLRDLHREFGEFHFGRRDMHMPVSRGQELVGQLSEKPPATFASFDVTHVETMDGAKLIFEDASWLLFRQSGTEPMLRIYSEATSVDKMQQLLAAGVKATD